MAVDFQCGLHIFVPKPFADKQNVRTKLDQQTGVAVTNIMNPYLFDAALFADAFHLVIQEAFGDVKQPISVLIIHQPGCIVFYHIAYTARNSNGTVALWRFRLKDQIFFIQPIERYMTVAAAEEEPPYVKESYAIDFTNYNPTVAGDQWGKTAGSWSFAQKIQWKKLDDGTVEQYKDGDDGSSPWQRSPGLYLMNLNSSGAYQNEETGVIKLTPGATYTVAMTFKFESWGNMWNAAGVAMYLGVGTDSNLPNDCYTGEGGWNGYQLNGAMLLETFQGDVKDWVTKTYTVTVPDVAKGRLLLQVAPYLANDAGDITAHCAITGGGAYTFTLKDVQIDRVCHHLHTQEVGAETSTCLKQGHEAYTLCSDCGAVTSGSKAPLPLADHDYGELIPEVPATHTESQLAAGTAAHYKCSVCKKLFDEDKAETTADALVIPAPEHSYEDEWKSDAVNHWKACSCGLIANQAAHSGGSATCKDKAVCAVCGAAYGETDSSNHTGETEVRNAIAATEEAAGYSGDVYCKDCGVKLKNGESIPKLTPAGPPETPATGEDSLPRTYAAILLLAGVGLMAAVAYGKRKALKRL